MDSETVISEWMFERRRHPMFGEPKGSYLDSVWDRNSGTYTARGYEHILEDIVRYMGEDGILTEQRSVIDIGSGPGTFAEPMSRLCRSVLCIDKSKGMLDRIESLRLPNVSTLLSDCMHLPEGLQRDVAFCSLCPPMNSPEGLRIMEKSAKELCIYISSANPCPGIETQIWKALGTDYSYIGYDTTYPANYLKSLGTSAELKFFSQMNEICESESTVSERMIRKISAYRDLTDDDIGTIRDTVSDHSENGTIHTMSEFRLGVLIWAPSFQISSAVHNAEEPVIH